MKKEHGCSDDRGVEMLEGASGNDVLQEVVQMTGLPEEYLHNEINSFLGVKDLSVKDLSIDQLRSVLLNYLETLNDEITQSHTKH